MTSFVLYSHQSSHSAGIQRKDNLRRILTTRCDFSVRWLVTRPSSNSSGLQTFDTDRLRQWSARLALWMHPKLILFHFHRCLSLSITENTYCLISMLSSIRFRLSRSADRNNYSTTIIKVYHCNLTSISSMLVSLYDIAFKTPTPRKYSCNVLQTHMSVAYVGKNRSAVEYNFIVCLNQFIHSLTSGIIT